MLVCLHAIIRRSLSILLLALLISPARVLWADSGAGQFPPSREPAIETGSVEHGSGHTYIIQPGDDLGSLALRFHTTIQALLQANNIASPNRIRAGDKLFIPYRLPSFSLTSPPDPRRGLAMAVIEPKDLASLAVGWYYTWAWCALPRCVPMVYFMELPPDCPALLLVGNEPNATRPFGGPISPADAAQKVQAIELACPATRLVVGNVSADDWRSAGGWGSGQDWLAEFLARYRDMSGHPFQQTLGVHCYSQALADYCLTKLAQLRQLYAGPMWVTEFGLLSGGAEQFSILLDFAAAQFERFAAYTNRQPHTGQGWELSTGVELVLRDGRLSPAGEVYVAWPNPLLSQLR